MRKHVHPACVSRVLRVVSAVLFFASFSIAFLTAQSSSVVVSTDNKIQEATAQTHPTTAPTPSEIHRNVDALAVSAHRGDQAAINELAKTIFERVGIPADVAGIFHFSQRVAQAETDYRKGNQPAVHESEIVAAHNNFIHAINLPEWALTSPDEVRQLRMQFVARYPQLLGSSSRPGQNGKLEILGANISPAESVFLATSLLYQKLYNPEFQKTAKERSENAVVPATAYLQRTNEIYNKLHGNTEDVDLVDLMRAANGLFSDLHISGNLRPEFVSLPSQSAAKGVGQ